MGPSRTLFKALGSLWLAVVVLMLLLVAMASATAYESTHGSERAQALFYQARWFQSLLALLGVNVLAALLARFPFTRRQAGFVATHVSVLLILAGAGVTQWWGIDGQLALREGQTASAFQLDQECLTLSRPDQREQVVLDIGRSVARAGGGAARPGPGVELGGVRAAIERYLPDSEPATEVLDDNPEEQTAVEVAIAAAGEEMRHWVLVEGSPDNLGTAAIRLHGVEDGDHLSEVLAHKPASEPASTGTVTLEVEGEAYDFPLEECLDRPVAVGRTGYTLHVLRYLPHAVVGEGHQLRSASSQPVNPAIEAEIQGPQGTGRQFAFARFPEFESMHAARQGPPIKLRFATAAGSAGPVPIEVYAARTGELGVRFNPEDGEPRVLEITEGQRIETPWPGLTFAILRRFHHARVEHTVRPVEPARAVGTPAVVVAVTAAGQPERLWLQKGQSRSLTIEGKEYRFRFGNKTKTLGYHVTLERFRIGPYPGTQRPRSYESHVALTDPAIGRRQSRVISMNRPARHGGYTLYQSSYHQEPEGGFTSVLSVSWDPGQPIVFAGYIGMLAGMIWTLAVRMIDRRRNRTAGRDASRPAEEGAGA